MSATWGDGAASASVAVAIGIVRTWVAMYTIGLPRKLRDARRLEIDCDLWEQRQLAEYTREPRFGTAVEMAIRAALGMLSDITWRVEAGLSARRNRSIKMNDSLTMKGVFFGAVTISVLPAAMGIAAIFGAGWGTMLERAIWGTLLLSGSAAIIVGLLFSDRRPALGIGLVATGAICVAVGWFFIPFITIPAGIAVVALAYFRARRTGWPNRAGTA